MRDTPYTKVSLSREAFSEMAARCHQRRGLHNSFAIMYSRTVLEIVCA